MNRLSSIDTKYHTWKLGVVLTDNVCLIFLISLVKLFYSYWFLIGIFLSIYQKPKSLYFSVYKNVFT